MAKPKVKKSECPFEPAKGKFIAKEVVISQENGILLPDSLKQRRMEVLESALEGVEAGDQLVIEAGSVFKIMHEGNEYFIFGQNDYCAKWKK